MTTKLKRIVSGKNGTFFICRCLNCGTTFNVAGFEFRVGKGKFCTKDCSDRYLRGKPRSQISDWRPNMIQRKKMALAGAKNFGSKHGRWKGGRRKDSSGYILIYKPEHPYPSHLGKYVYEHRLAMENKLGRFLLPTEVVHHINNVVDDNRIGNLHLFKNHSEHIAHHNKSRSRRKNGTFL